MPDYKKFLALLTASVFLNFFILSQPSVWAGGPDGEKEEEELEKFERRKALWIAKYIPKQFQMNEDDDKPDKREKLAVGFSRLEESQLSLLPPLHVYFKVSPDGKIEIRCYSLASEVTLKIFGPNAQGKVNYVLRSHSTNESFAHSRNPTYSGKRVYPMSNDDYRLLSADGEKVVKSLDRGHGGDHADSIDDMTYDQLNYTPQDKNYNRWIRNPLVRYGIRPVRGKYREISIYSKNPKLTSDYTPIPEGFVFISYLGEKKNFYFFPNYMDYSKIKLGSGKESKYKKYLDVFSIPSSNVFTPFIFSGEVDLQTINKRMRSDFRTAQGLLEGDLSLIPHNKRFIPVTAVQALHRQMALQLYEQAASLEFNSIRYKLDLVEIFTDPTPVEAFGTDVQDTEKARKWFRVSEEQIEEDSTLEEKLELFPFYIDKNFALADRNNGRVLLEQIKDQAKEEDEEETYSDLYELALDTGDYMYGFAGNIGRLLGQFLNN